MTDKRVLVLLAEGAEEMETTITVDVLRRAEIEVVLAGVDGDAPVRCSRGVRIVPDAALADVSGPFDAIALPGGAEGARRLAASAEVGALLREHVARGGLVAAVCAAPAALVAHGLFEGARMTCHPSVVDRIAHPVEARVLVDGALITSQGPGTTFEFALALVRALVGDAVADAVARPMILP